MTSNCTPALFYLTYNSYLSYSQTYDLMRWIAPSDCGSVLWTPEEVSSLWTYFLVRHSKQDSAAHLIRLKALSIIWPKLDSDRKELKQWIDDYSNSHTLPS